MNRAARRTETLGAAADWLRLTTYAGSGYPCRRSALLADGWIRRGEYGRILGFWLRIADVESGLRHSRRSAPSCSASAARSACAPGSIAARESRPGLVLGLDRGGSCRGMAFRVAGDASEEVHRLSARARTGHQCLSGAHACRVPSTSGAARRPRSAYIVDRDHQQYAGALSVRSTRQPSVSGRSASPGGNDDYVRNTLTHLRAAGHPRPLAGRCRRASVDDGLRGARAAGSGRRSAPSSASRCTAVGGSGGRIGAPAVSISSASLPLPSRRSAVR